MIVLRTKAELRHISEELIDEIREMDDGSKATLIDVLEVSGYDMNEFDSEELMELNDQLLRTSKAYHIKLDMSEHEGIDEGLPYHLEFIVKNRRAQIKCPRCGSKNTARILYGMPAYSEEMERKLNEGKLYLGGCCVTEHDPARHCNECYRNFATPPVIEKEGVIEDYRDIVTGISFSCGGFFGGETSIEIKRTKEGIMVRVNRYSFDPKELPEKSYPMEYKITEMRWQRLVNKLYTNLYVHEWKKKYVDYGVLDGEQWNLEISLTGRRKRTYYGSNDYPPYWKELNQLLKPFMRVRK